MRRRDNSPVVSLKAKISLFISLTIFFVLLSSSLITGILRIREIQNELIDKDILISERVLPDMLDDFTELFFFQYDLYVGAVKNRIRQYPELITFRIFNSEGDVVFDYAKSHVQNNQTIEKATDPQIIEIIHSRKTYQDRSVYRNESTIRVFVPYIDRFGNFRNVAEFHFSLQKIRDATLQVIFSFLVLLFIFSAVGVFITLFVVGWVTRPIATLSNAAEIIGKGNLDMTIPITSKDELGALAESFNKMALQLKSSYTILEEKVRQRTAELEEAKKSLEEKVQERTAELLAATTNLEDQVAKRTDELKVKLDELSQLNQVMIGREVKMTELKNEIAALKEQLNQLPKTP